MIYIGNHLSVSNGYEAMGRKMLELGGSTFAFFTRNPRGGKSREIEPEDAEGLRRILGENHCGTLVAHGSYTMNLCSAKPDTRANGLDMLGKDLRKMEILPEQYYNFHPGSHTGQGAGKGIEEIADALNRSMWDGMHTTVLLETMAGKGSEVGRSFEELREILDRIRYPGRMGVCLDTCHVWDAGYDIAGDPDGVFDEFDRVIGLDRLKAVHLNDSKNELGSHKDRHEKLGKGKIGAEALRRIVRHPALQGLPFILETPNEDAGYRMEIQTVKEWMNSPG